MELITIPVGFMEVNAYLYYDPDMKEGVVIDPGFDAERIWAVIQKAGVRIVATVLTHGHFDHISAVHPLFQYTASLLYASRAESMVLRNANINASMEHSEIPIEIAEYIPLEEGDEIKVGGAVLKTILTPGHTIGSLCLYDAAEGILFAGDTLFRRSVGRADFPTGDEAALLLSVRDKLYDLPDETRVLPGHGSETTIGYEKANNPYVRFSR